MFLLIITDNCLYNHKIRSGKRTVQFLQKFVKLLLWLERVTFTCSVGVYSHVCVCVDDCDCTQLQARYIYIYVYTVYIYIERERVCVCVVSVCVQSQLSTCIVS
jgi:hypothetical protein